MFEDLHITEQLELALTIIGWFGVRSSGLRWPAINRSASCGRTRARKPASIYAHCGKDILPHQAGTFFIMPEAQVKLDTGMGKEIRERSAISCSVSTPKSARHSVIAI